MYRLFYGRQFVFLRSSLLRQFLQRWILKLSSDHVENGAFMNERMLSLNRATFRVIITFYLFTMRDRSNIFIFIEPVNYSLISTLNSSSGQSDTSMNVLSLNRATFRVINSGGKRVATYEEYHWPNRRKW